MSWTDIAVAQLEVNPQHVAQLISKTNIRRVSQVLQLSTPELARRAGISTSSAKQIKLEAARTIVRDGPRCLRSSELLKGSSKARPRLSFGCPVLNDALGGGILTEGITEIVGESAAAKTQLCLQLSVVVQFAKEHGGLHGSALYICTEDPFPNRRM
eukprot:m.559264 g.559264  ORF g.559264 m.559264 type:complete len:157 (+) comp22204_c0_seq6:262-732(+)